MFVTLQVSEKCEVKSSQVAKTAKCYAVRRNSAFSIRTRPINLSTVDKHKRTQWKTYYLRYATVRVVKIRCLTVCNGNVFLPHAQRQRMFYSQ